jgi:hypothetical protein
MDNKKAVPGLCRVENPDTGETFVAHLVEDQIEWYLLRGYIVQNI